MGMGGQLLLSLRDIMTSVLFYCAIRGIDTPLDMSMKLPKQEEEKKEESAVPEKAVEEKAPEAEKPADDEDDIDLFGSDDEDDAEIEAERNRLLAESQEKKKKGVIAKSSVVFDIKPFDDETDLKEVETMVRAIEMPGLEWKAAELKEIAFGIQKLVMSCVVEDDLVPLDLVEEKITEFDDHVQSVDIASFNKL